MEYGDERLPLSKERFTAFRQEINRSSFLRRQFAKAKAMNRYDFEPEAASPFDVVILDWSQRDTSSRDAVSTSRFSVEHSESLPMHSDETLIQADELRTFVSALFQKTGMPSFDADSIAEVLVGTDLLGIFSHGTRLAPNYLKHILDGHMKAHPQPKVERETAAMAVVDADRGIGHLAARDGMRRAIEKASHVGVGMVNVRRSHHLGAASMYAMQALAHGMIGFTTTNTGGPSGALRRARCRAGEPSVGVGISHTRRLSNRH
jgi:hypothetical protein